METVSQTPFIDQSQLNIITNPEDIACLGSDFKDLDYIILTNDVEHNMKNKPMRLNMEKARIASQIIGCKAKSANTLSHKIIDFYSTQSQDQLKGRSSDPSKRYYVYTSRDKFIALLRKFLPEFSMTKEQNVYDFELALEIIEQKKSLIILLGGTSGCGKSTVASLLASRFGIPTVLSTDSIRHVMRNFMSTDEFPVLFASTYEVATKVKLDENISEHKKTVLGFNQQAELIHQRLIPILESYYNRGESIIIEGVHLTPDFMVKMVQKYNNCLPFLIYIKKEDKHKERFAVRSKFMTLDSRANKYVKHFGNIRTISKHLVKKADSHLIPKVDNTNVDKSVGVIHRTIVRCLRRMIIGESVYNHDSNNVLMLFENFNKVSKKLWSKDAVKSYINQKVLKTHKNDKHYREFGEDQNARNPNADIQDHVVTKPGEVEADKIEINEINEGEIDIRVLNLEKTPSKVQLSRRKDFLDPDDDEDESHRQKRKNSKLLATPVIQVNGPSPTQSENIAPIPVIEEVNKPQQSELKETTKIEEAKTEHLTVPENKQRTHLRYSELERLFNTKKVISIKGNPSKFHLRTIKNAIATYNKKKPDSETYFRFIQTNERYIIYRQRREDSSDPNKIEVPLMPNELIRKKKDSVDGGRKEKGKMESGTSEFDVEPSEEEPHAEGRPSSTSSGSKHLKASAFKNPGTTTGDSEEGEDHIIRTPKKLVARHSSDRLVEASDGLDEDGDDDDHTSIEILESGNSISEQTEEDDEEDEVINHHGYVKRFKAGADV